MKKREKIKQIRQIKFHQENRTLENKKCENLRLYAIETTLSTNYFAVFKAQKIKVFLKKCIYKASTCESFNNSQEASR